MVLDNKHLQRLQGVCLELIEEVDRICRLHHIEYTLDGGTLLGAVREHGFIPWDDDADIAMTRAEYNKFCDACKESLNMKRFFLQEYRTDPYYPWGYSKLRMNGTRLVQLGQEHLKFNDGIFIDIFIYDPVPNGFLMRRLHAFACFCIRKCQYSIVGKKSAKTALLRCWYAVLNMIPKAWVFRQLEKLISATNNVNGVLSSHKTYPYPRKSCRYGLPTKCFTEYIDLPFEEHLFRCMKDYDTYLSLLYGDYMTPTPPSGIRHYPIGLIDFGEGPISE